jgi:hypothetical protein
MASNMIKMVSYMPSGAFLDSGILEAVAAAIDL